VTLKCPQCGKKAANASNCGFWLAHLKFTETTEEGDEVEKEGTIETQNCYTWKDGYDTK